MDRILEKKKWYQKKQIWFIIGAIFGLLVLYIIFLSDHSSKLYVETDKITIETVTENIFPDYMAEIGRVHPIQTIYLDAMEAGRVEEIVIEENTMVKEGDIILKLSNPDLNLRIMNSESELAEQINRLRDTKLNMETTQMTLSSRILELRFQLQQDKRDYLNNKLFFEKGLISQEEYMISKEKYELTTSTLELFVNRNTQDSIYRRIQLSQLDESVNRMRENLQLVSEKLENLTVRASISGLLGDINAEVGEQIVQGQRLGVINVLDNYRIQADVDEHYIDRINSGLKASFERNGELYNLEVTKVYTVVTDGTFQVDMNFIDTLPDNIRTGQTYRIKIELGEPITALQIPQGGFFQSTGGQWVYVVDQTGEFAEKRKIKIGKQNPQAYEVIEGLKAGERVIISSYDNFGDAEKLIFKK